jgi:hypothetical protein
MASRIIPVHIDAPAKPPAGAACNGCGVCCLSEPCPVGIAISGRRSSACAALVFDADGRRYRCGLLADPKAYWRWLPASGVATAQRLARRWIAAGSGCDSFVD